MKKIKDLIFELSKYDENAYCYISDHVFNEIIIIDEQENELGEIEM